jgi:hypothetical protein
MLSVVGIITLCVIGKDRERGRGERGERARWRRNWRRMEDKNGPGKRLNEKRKKKRGWAGSSKNA